MRAHRAHAPWTGRLNERRNHHGVAQAAPEIACDDTKGETWGDEVGELVAGLRVFNRIVAEYRARRPDMPEFEAKRYAHARLKCLQRPGEDVWY